MESRIGNTPVDRAEPTLQGTVDVAIAPQDTRYTTHTSVHHFPYSNEWARVAQDLWVGRLADTRCIMDACEPRGLAFRPTRQFGDYYAVVRTNARNPSEPHWDPDQKIRRAIAVSRLVHPTVLGYDYAARLVFRDDGKLRRVVPFEHPLPAYGGRLERPCLSPEEWQQVGKLMPELENAKQRLSTRIVRAIWYHEKAALEYWLEVRWMLLAAGVEALVGDSAGKGGLGQRFKDGLLKLAQCSDCQLTLGDASDTWHERRCQVTHGQDLPPGSSQGGEANDELYWRVERILGASLLKILADSTFSNHFRDDASVKKWLVTLSLTQPQWRAVAPPRSGAAESGGQ